MQSSLFLKKFFEGLKALCAQALMDPKKMLSLGLIDYLIDYKDKWLHFSCWVVGMYDQRRKSADSPR
jgi:hypothetical protein